MSCAGSILSENADGSPISLDTLKLLLTRESVTEPPQVCSYMAHDK
jgi:hypothetical protein